MLGLGNSLLRNPGAGFAPYTGSITSWWKMQESGLGTSVALADVMGVDDLTPSLGQALDGDGVNQYVQTSDQCTRFLNGGATLSLGVKVLLTAAPVFDAPISGSYYIQPFAVRFVSAARIDIQIELTSTGSLTFNYDYNFSTGVWYDVYFTYDCTSASSVPVLYINGVQVALTNSVGTLPNGTSRFIVSASATRSSVRVLAGDQSGSIGRYLAGQAFTFFVSDEIVSPSTALSVLNSVTSTTATSYFTSSNVVWGCLDKGTGTTLDAGKFSGCTGVTLYNTPSWANASHLSVIPQKGLGGGNYTGGIGASVLYTFDTGDDEDPGVLVSTNDYDALGDTFTWSGWIYKPNANSPDGCSFWSTLDAAAASPRGFIVRGGMVARSQNLSDIQFEVYGATTNSNDAVVAADATGWWFVAVTMKSGVPTIYVARQTASSLRVDAGTAAGSLSVTTAGDNRLTIGHRVGSVAGQTQDNCEAGTKFDGTMYRAGVALTEAELLKVFKFYKSRYL